MKNIKLKIRIILVLLLISMFYFIGHSFASYVTSVNGQMSNSTNQNIIAGFVINNRLANNMDIDIDDFNPGDSRVVDFTVSNYLNNGTTTFKTDVSMKYRIYISSTSLPLSFSLKLNNSNVSLTCSGVVGVSCYTSEASIRKNTDILRNYKLTISFPQNNANNNNAPFDYSYSNCLDVVSLRIESWQSS